MSVTLGVALACAGTAGAQQPWRLPKAPPDRPECATSGDVSPTFFWPLMTMVRRVETNNFTAARPDIDAAAAAAQSPREKMFVATFETWLAGTTGDTTHSDAAWAEVLATRCFRKEDLDEYRDQIARAYAPQQR